VSDVLFHLERPKTSYLAIAMTGEDLPHRLIALELQPPDAGRKLFPFTVFRLELLAPVIVDIQGVFLHDVPFKDVSSGADNRRKAGLRPRCPETFLAFKRLSAGAKYLAAVSTEIPILAATICAELPSSANLRP
jgi:hypothetical protein